MKIEVRLSDVAPPAPDPLRTIYRDVLNLPDPVKLGLTVRYFNFDDVALYFQITGSGPGYTFDTVNLGSLGSGANAYRNLDEFASRAKPSAGEFTAGELVESIKLILKAYTDAAYTDLKWTHERSVSVIWIKSDDPAFTQDVLNDFDDGTVQTWAVTNELKSNPTVGVATDYVLSAPYSLLMTQVPSSAPGQIRSRLYKSFITPDRPTVYAIVNFRLRETQGGNVHTKNVRIQRDDTVLVWLGKPYAAVEGDETPLDKWVRVVVPLPRNTTLEVRVVLETFMFVLGARAYLNMDDFKIVSK